MNKLIVDQKEFQGFVNKICRDILISGWKPDYIVGITRGGLVPAVLISQYLNIPMHTLEVSLRDSGDTESNLWMAIDAFGSPEKEIIINNEDDIGSVLDAASSLLEIPEPPSFKNILIVDDINDTGSTFNWIMNDWRSGCFPNDPTWNDVWNGNVKFAVIIDNLSSQCQVKMDFVGKEINKAENDVWVDFPWEDWWTK